MLLDQDRRFHNTQKRGAIKSELFLWKARVIPFIISKERREFYFTFFQKSLFVKGLHKTFWDTTKKRENKNLTEFLFQYIFQKSTGH